MPPFFPISSGNNHYYVVLFPMLAVQAKGHADGHAKKPRFEYSCSVTFNKEKFP